MSSSWNRGVVILFGNRKCTFLIHHIVTISYFPHRSLCNQLPLFSLVSIWPHTTSLYVYTIILTTYNNLCKPSLDHPPLYEWTLTRQSQTFCTTFHLMHTLLNDHLALSKYAIYNFMCTQSLDQITLPKHTITWPPPTFLIHHNLTSNFLHTPLHENQQLTSFTITWALLTLSVHPLINLPLSVYTITLPSSTLCTPSDHLPHTPHTS